MKLINRPQDKVKVMVLIPSVIGVLLYFLLFVLPMMAKMRQEASPSATPVEQTNQNAATSSAADPAAILPKTTTPELADNAAPPDTTNDPFKPPMGSAALAADKIATPAAAHTTTPTTVPPAAISPLQTTPMNVKSPGSTGSPAIASTAPGSTPAQSQITLQGVVLAERAVGVFKSGEQTFYKHVGDQVDGMVLQYVSDSGVILSKSGQRYSLEIGHSDMSPYPPHPGASAIAMATNDRSVAIMHNPEPQPTTVAVQPPASVPDPIVQVHSAAPDKQAMPIANMRPAAPLHKLSADSHLAAANSQPDKIVVSSAALVGMPGMVKSVPTDTLSPELHQVSMLVHKKDKPRKRHARRTKLSHRRHGHKTRRPRARAASFMARAEA